MDMASGLRYDGVADLFNRECLGDSKVPSEAVPITVAPVSLASCTANTPTPPAAPPMRIVSPNRGPIASRAAAAVRPATGSVLATSSLMPSGV